MIDVQLILYFREIAKQLNHLDNIKLVLKCARDTIKYGDLFPLFT